MVPGAGRSLLAAGPFEMKCFLLLLLGGCAAVPPKPSIVEVGGCHYVIFPQSHGTFQVVHAANCPNHSLQSTGVMMPRPRVFSRPTTNAVPLPKSSQDKTWEAYPILK
jgi:hypothetical protein